ncbi:excinuclease ABC subunit A [Candidatus Saccharibacteria bacterium RIFCSPHIGHO2_12_FULL_49_19]|nr:MAG: excinuclease ABC subunit A [Candidatus Saccharibacteria bacterium RIFCSPHIGHO2_01_FULL_49_21]OGL36706.1 MAG: excinuclease ABC subunit A [Candidatus Saccharibacteria bacterium RIFCSPHIGHO2_12_FULL_49_19]OGL37972.1 MAG: excinuclease ABC subunit A [Candidatus Saccharibacteria bacterium RIFCSPLOWO2_01_FULL_49_22]
MSDSIKVQGAREHNLKNISLEIPRGTLTVITGLSGSGKSSLAFDTIYAEGQRRYVESLSAYARQFLGLMEKPDVDQIDGLSPAISIDQKSTSRNPRSTVATVTEVYDYLRLLFARIGVPHCPVCGKPVSRQTTQAIVEKVAAHDKNARLMVLAPIVVARKGAFEHIPEKYLRAGFARARVDSVVYALDEFPELDKKYKHTIEIVVDRLVNDEASRGRLTQSIEQALSIADDILTIHNADKNTSETYSLKYACPDHPDVSIPELEPRTFSFNAPHGACPICTGLGSRLEVDPELVIPNGRLTIAEGAIRPFNRFNADAWYTKKMQAVADRFRFSLQVPTAELRKDQLDKILYGTGDENYLIKLGVGRHFRTTYEGVIPNLERRHKETSSDFMRREIEKFMRARPCHACQGRRLKPEVLAVTVDRKSIMDISDMSIDDAMRFFSGLKLNETENMIAKQILKEINARLKFMVDVGLNYLNLSRSATTLSGGEAQRIRLATQIGSGLQGVLYVLDEPSIGLHQRDNRRLINTLKRLRDLGNTVLIVEHDEETIRSADHVVDMGPGAGRHGGEVVAIGKPADIPKAKASVTGEFLSGKRQIAIPKVRRSGNGKKLVIKGARQHNLKGIDVDIPLGKMIVVAGVSGSGKSSLINDVLARELSARLMRAHVVPGKHEEIVGIDQLDKVIIIDQSPIGRTPRSNPATYTGLLTPIRELFAQMPEARVRGYGPGRFSFNVRGGRCENCAGDGVIKIEMHFLPDVYVPCEVCHGKRYNPEALEIHYKGKTISDVLEMTCEEAYDFFESIPVISRKLKTIVDVGLGYITLGQPATTLSGGEAQRVKLATELSRRPTGRTLYILDEPTTGLHMADVQKLLEVLHALVDTGNSMIVIEHNLDVIKSADHIIDMGPEGGEAGGLVVVSGTPEQVAKDKKSYTGQFLKKALSI